MCGEKTVVSLPAGTKLGPYEIVAPLGAGGMGEVYRARDAKLGREVAIKVLPTHLAGDAHAIERLEREARVLASASHPNIIAIFDFGSSDGLIYVVMELLDGNTLRALLGDGALPVRRTVDYAIQIAQGLGAAHDRGIVHRDLKPENLFVTRDGHVKILDFGLARQHVLLGANETTVAQQTEPGTVLGTVGYMAPEQVQGKPADARSDIFAFGAVLYEMLSGRRAFKGQSAAETMHAILRDDPPDLLESVKSLPPALSRIVGHCLEKSPDLRFQSARDVAFNLESVATLSSGSRGDALAGVPRAGRRRATAVALLAAGAGVLVGALLTGALRKAPAIEPPTYRRLTFDRGTVSAARFAPDGRTVVYSAAWRGQPSEIFTARLDSRESRPLGLGHAVLQAVSSASELALALDADGTFGGATIGRVPLAGGATRASVENGTYADWVPDGANLAVVRLEGNEQRIEFPIGHVVHRTGDGITHLRVSPDGSWVAFAEHPVASAYSGGHLVAVDRAGSRKVLSKAWTDIWGVAWRPDGREVWFTAADGTDYKALHAATLDGRERLVTRMLGQVDLQDISRDGRVLVSQADFRDELIVRTAGASTERTLTWLSLSGAADISADGNRVLFTEMQPGGGNGQFVYLRPMDGSPAIRLGEGSALSLSPDGKWALTLSPSGKQLVALPTGAGEPRDLTRAGFDYSHHFRRSGAWFPDSSRVIFSAWQNGVSRTFVQDIDGGEPRAVGPPGVGGASVSPDGRHICAGPFGGPASIYDLDGADPTPIKGLETGDSPIRWSQDGRSLICRRQQGLVTEVSAIEIATGRRVPLWHLAAIDPAGADAINSLAVTPDGKSYAYSYYRTISDLYVVDGLK